MRKNQPVEPDDKPIRLDKWLWAARFYKTRQLAHEALELGRVQVNGERAKASRYANLGDTLLIRINQLEYHIEITGLVNQRKSAKEVHALYREDPVAQGVSEEKALLLRAERASFPHGEGRPSKKARRELMHFKDSF